MGGAPHPAGVGLNGLARPDALLRRQDGEVLTEVVDERGPRPDHVVGFLFDGCNPNVLHDAVDAGEAPNVARLIEMGTSFEHGAMSSMPTVTLANHTGILTGCHPGHHGVLNNAWFDRATGEQVITNSPATWPWAMATLSPDVETMYQAVRRTWPDAFTLAANEPCDTGADFGTFHILRDGRLPERPPSAEELPFATDRFVRPEKKYRTASRIDHTGLEITLGVWGDGYQGTVYPRPRFTWVNFSLTDAAFHQGGPYSDIARASIRDTDARLGEVLARGRAGRGVRPDRLLPRRRPRDGGVEPRGHRRLGAGPRRHRHPVPGRGLHVDLHRGHLTSSDGAVAAGVAGRAAVGAGRDRVHAAEVDVGSGPHVHRPAGFESAATTSGGQPGSTSTWSVSQWSRGAVDAPRRPSARRRPRPRPPAGWRCGSACCRRCRARARRDRRASRTTVGAIIDATRTPGGAAWKPSGWRSSSPSMLLRRMPVPGMTSPEHSPFDVVIAAMLPSASVTLTWVVPREVDGAPVGAGELGRPPAVHLDHVLDQRLPPTPGCATARPDRAAQLQGQPDQPSAERRRRVGEDAPAAVVDPQRLSFDDAVGGEVLGGHQPVAAHHRDECVVQRCRTGGRRPCPRPSAVRRSARSGFRTRSPGRSSRPPGANTAAVAGSRVRIGSRMPEDRGLAGRERHPVGGQAGGGRDHRIGAGAVRAARGRAGTR